MKKFLLSATLVLSFALYAFLNTWAFSASSSPTPIAASEPIPSSSNFSNPRPAQTVVATEPPPEKTQPVTPTSLPRNSTSQTVPTAPVVQAPPANRLYRDGTYTGSSADAYYGYVQVQVTTKNDRIVDLQFLDYPHDRGTSVRINSYAAPALRSEAIQVQSAQVDTISGATDTSMAFRESLSTALDQARV